MLMYLRQIDNPIVHRDGGDYLQTPFPAPENWEWIEGSWDGLTPYKPLSLVENLKAVFDEQAQEVQVAFYAFVPQVLTALENNRPDIAQALIQSAEVPSELQAVKDALLNIFN